MKKLWSILVTIAFGVLLAAVVMVIGALVTLACVSLVVAFCVIFDLYPDYRLVAAIIGFPIIAATTVLSLIKYVKAVMPRKIKEQTAQTVQSPSAPSQPRAPSQQ